MTLPLDVEHLRDSCRRCSLQQLCLPAGIDEADMERLDLIVRRKRTLARGERLFRQGDRLDWVYVARAGAIKTLTLNADGEEQVIGFHIPGELVGMDALGDGAHRCEAVALVPTEVCDVPFDRLAEVATQVPGLQQQLMRVIGQTVGRDQDHLGMLVRRQANERIALFLHGLIERYRQRGGADHDLTLPMSREDIASYLGLVLETVSRGFTRLQDDGVIEVHGRKVRVADPVALRRLAHVD